MLTLFDQNYVANSYLQDMAVVFEIKGAVEMCQEFKVSAEEAVNRIAKRFELNFKYRDTSWFLYMYLLGEGNIKEDLSLPNGGRHYLHGKTMDQARRLLDSLISYGKSYT